LRLHNEQIPTWVSRHITAKPKIIPKVYLCRSSRGRSVKKMFGEHF
jgi:hypothetical protein